MAKWQTRALDVDTYDWFQKISAHYRVYANDEIMSIDQLYAEKKKILRDMRDATSDKKRFTDQNQCLQVYLLHNIIYIKLYKPF